jgi:hypothetical protein
MHDILIHNPALPSHSSLTQTGAHHFGTNFSLKVINFAADNKSWRLVCNSGNEQSCKGHCSKQFPGNALAIDECTKAVTEAFGGGSTACFPMTSLVTRKEDGIVALSQLRVGDEILVPSGENVAYDPVIGFLHWDDITYTDFIVVSCGEVALRIHRDHLLPVIRGSRDLFVRASEVKEDDSVQSLWIDGTLSPLKVTSLGSYTEKGLCCPLTMSGKIIVDSVACSCYSSPRGLLPINLTHSLCHASMAPLRAKYMFTNDSSTKKVEQTNGIHPYAKALMTAVTGMVFA